MVKICSWFIVLCLTATTALAAHKHLEKEYQAVWCEQHHGTTEYLLPDDTRVDCLTNEYAIEFDFAGKWAESIGQALYYSLRTDRTPGVVLILERQSDRRFLKRIEAVADVYGIKVWIMEPKDLRP
ncbi:MAG: hypothetical protein HZA15_15545 [Nitrospirae bacterium]|nr:hypothetical protein [Nitrospirota bacterium]